MGRVLLAVPRGFCAGVDRAVEIVEQVLADVGAPLYVRGQIVHNRRVVDDLAARGVVFVDRVDDVPPGSTLVFSAHGVPPSVRTDAARRGLRVFDATCPLVAKVHGEARRYARGGYDIVLIGQAGHDEVVGVVGEAPDRVVVVNPATAGDVTLAPDRPAVMLSQTTLTVDEVDAAAARLRIHHPDLRRPPTDDVCYASQNRQDAVEALAARCPLVVVVGSANSHNSRRLAETARRHGAAAHLVDGAGDLDVAWFTDVETVGVTAGASAPERAVQEVVAALAGHGFETVEQLTVRVESERFALPAALRGSGSAVAAG
ncbi:4-hydroxy-3-methylbut-2-enyl diphosphate reductase [Dactylosporangium salmoneum]|uniref:4-hydroxy-3-methylbut-2-enyl diphosphate reductase n=1 Tax=Dactylosporangium salmoneum TaxID=53361 RepID=A0ABP5UW71_9ACTN